MAVGHAVHHRAMNVFRERAQEGHLGGAEHLDAFVGKILEESGERERRPVDRRFADEAMQSLATGHQLELQLGAVGFEKMGYGNAVDGFGHG